MAPKVLVSDKLSETKSMKTRALRSKSYLFIKDMEKLIIGEQLKEQLHHIQSQNILKEWIYI